MSGLMLVSGGTDALHGSERRDVSRLLVPGVSACILWFCSAPNVYMNSLNQRLLS